MRKVVDDPEVMVLKKAKEKYADCAFMFLFVKDSYDPEEALGRVYAVADSEYEWESL
jgi:hypothetical protein